MRQTLFYIPTSINFIPGIPEVPVFGFGLVLVIFLISILIASISRIIKTRKIDSELCSYLVLGLVVGFVIVQVVPNTLEPEGFPVRGYGVCLLVGILSAIGLATWIGSSRGLSVDTIISLGFWVTICGLIGTRIFYIIEYREQMEVWHNGNLQLLPTLYNIFNIANGGLVVIGGIIGGAAGGIIFAVRNKYNVLLILDIIVPTVMLGIAIGRIGCFLNGCCFGEVSNLPWAVTFPENSPAHLCQIERGDTTYCGLKFKQFGNKKITNACCGGGSSNSKIHNDHNHNDHNHGDHNHGDHNHNDHNHNDHNHGDHNHNDHNHGDHKVDNYLILEKILPDSDKEQAEKLKTGLRLNYIKGLNAENVLETYAVKTAGHVYETIIYFQRENPNQKVQFNFTDEKNQADNLNYNAVPAHSGILPVHPTQIYSSILALILCGILLTLGRIEWFKIRKGGVAAVFLILYGLVRFCIEIVRTDEEPFLNTGITIAQNLSIILIIIGLILLIYVTIKKVDIKAEQTRPN
ncbi:MAG: prolipoprotein diacylglyceryl transferase [Planctomycetaceae bacterium]|jgi:prolipoprotein diacylglyceryltransferase|nr:prolipoprotein diacylglyceryl transferase [Planctomycetaceae bacterium]